MKLRRRRGPLPSTVKLSKAAAEVIRSAANQAFPSETGGVLIGWQDADCVYVDLAVEVPDENATHTSYERDHTRAQAVVDQVVAGQPKRSPVGYTGDWHTHPAACGPSPTDVASIERIGSDTSSPVVLLIAVRQEPPAWKFTARVAHRRRSTPATVIEGEQAT